MIDRKVTLTVIWMLGGALALLLGGILYSSITGKQIDGGVLALAGSALGNLGSLLSGQQGGKETTGKPALPKPALTPRKLP